MGSGTMGEAALELLATLIAERVVMKLSARGVGDNVLLNVSEAAMRIGRSESAIRSMIHRGELKAIKAGKRAHIEPAELEAWRERNRA